MIGLAGVVVGFALQAVNGWLTERRAERKEHRQWRREREFDVLTRFIDVSRRIYLFRVGKVGAYNAHDLSDELMAAFSNVDTLLDSKSETHQKISTVYDICTSLLGSEESWEEGLSNKYAHSHKSLRQSVQAHFRTV